MAFIDYTLKVFGENTSNLVFLVVDNKNLKKQLQKHLTSRLLDAIPSVTSSRQYVSGNPRACLGKSQSSDAETWGIKNAAELLKKTDLRPVKQQTTAWASTFALIQRYQKLKGFVDQTNAQIAIYMPGPAEDLALSDLFTQVKKFESVSMKLQEDSIDLATKKILFYGLKMDFESLEHYLGDDGICTNTPFESAIETAIGKSH